MKLQLGVYKHYKGLLYRVLGLAYDANTGRLNDTVGVRTVVIYQRIPQLGHRTPELYVRTFEDFIRITDGKTKRFSYLGPELTEDML